MTEDERRALGRTYGTVQRWGSWADGCAVPIPGAASSPSTVTRTSTMGEGANRRTQMWSRARLRAFTGSRSGRT